MNAYQKLIQALDLLQSLLGNQIKELSIDEDLIRFRLILKDNTRIYVNFNNYGQYSYVIHYSPDPLDRVIIDNYDEDWDVDSSPNHQHNRFKTKGEETEFTGDPLSDIPKLVQLI